MKQLAFIAPVIAVLTCASVAETPVETTPEMAAVLANDRAYEAAYAKGDVKALADFFSDDAEYTSDSGQSFSGRAEIESSIRDGLEVNKGAKLEIAVKSVQILAPEVVLEKGSTRVTAKDGEVNGALYTAIHVKKDGKWKIRQLVETPLPKLTAGDHLSELGWLAGQWEEADKAAGVSVRSKYEWARGGSFLTRNVTVKREGATVLEGWQIIGWDPINEEIRSWNFDSDGAFSEGRWTRDGERWLVRESGVTVDGNRTTAENTFQRGGPDSFSWESGNRTLDGEPLPGIGRIEIRRVKGE